jgi:hypothetical protein
MLTRMKLILEVALSCENILVQLGPRESRSQKANGWYTYTVSKPSRAMSFAILDRHTARTRVDDVHRQPSNDSFRPVMDTESVSSQRDQTQPVARVKLHSRLTWQTQFETDAGCSIERKRRGRLRKAYRQNRGIREPRQMVNFLSDVN